MAELPSGVVTFLFSDIEGSTRLVKQLRERYGDVLAEHQRLLRAAFANHGGHEIDTQGDSFFVAFPRARDAVLAAVEAQLALQSHLWPEGAEVRVRMGIHSGQAVASEGRYTGLAVHRAARTGAAGHGGQLLVSQATQTLLEDEEEELQVSFRDLGEQRLEGLDRPVRLYQVVADGLPNDFPPLRHDAQLAEAAEAALAAPTTRRRRLLIGGAAVVVAAAVALAVALLARGGTAITVRPNSVGVIDPRRNAVIDQIAVGVRPGPITAGAGALWVANLEDLTVSRIDSRTRSVTRSIPVQRTPTGIAYGENGVWIANGLGTIQRVDPEFNTADDPIETGAGRATTASVAVGFGSVWFASANANVVRLDPSSDRTTAPLFSGFSPSGVAVDKQSVWVANRGDNNVYRFSPRTNEKVKEFTVSAGPTAITTGAGAVWVAAGGSDSVTRIDPLLGSADSISVGRRPSAIAYGAGAVWVANEGDGTISRIDPATNDVTATIHVGNVPQGIAVAAGLVWVAVQAR